VARHHPSHSAAGVRAKAGALGDALLHAVGVRPDDFEDQAEDYEALAMSLVRDLVPVPAVPALSMQAPVGAASPDAELIQLCDRLVINRRLETAAYDANPEDEEK
jgi:hypothetical protein